MPALDPLPEKLPKNRVQRALDEGRDIAGLRMDFADLCWPWQGNLAFVAVRVVRANLVHQRHGGTSLCGIIVSPVAGHGCFRASIAELSDPTPSARRRRWIYQRAWHWYRELVRARKLPERRQYLLRVAQRTDRMWLLEDWTDSTRLSWATVKAGELRSAAELLAWSIAKDEWPVLGDSPDIGDPSEMFPLP